jgi:hypothetical protein
MNADPEKAKSLTTEEHRGSSEEPRAKGLPLINTDNTDRKGQVLNASESQELKAKRASS